MKAKKFFTILVCSVMLFGISCSDENLPVQTADNDPAQARLLSDEVEDATDPQNELLYGQWKVIEENDAWDYDLIHPVDYYGVWEFFPDGKVSHYYNINNIDERFKTYELKSDSLYIYYDKTTGIEYGGTYIYRCQFIDAEKNKIRIEFLQGILTDMPQPLLWIFERVNKDTPSEQETLSAINGIWEITMIRISDELTTIGSSPDNDAIFPNISIAIPKNTQGEIAGNTFYNKIGFQFEMKEHQQISFKNYGGTRIAEDNWGMAFSDHIMRVTKFEISNYELTFMDSQDNPLIVFIKKN
ncbi:MAG: hypothetical protein LBS54_02110 [Dysgonamonadaceae bacterium]|jgi:hypothetical protein|nr:hypothetical protein [Dysgonamonadaceae bacterium]